MTELGSRPASIPGACTVEWFASQDAAEEQPPTLLIEIPHGATKAAHYTAIRRRLRGPFPERLHEFFFVNTDVGAPECARAIARLLSASAGGPAPHSDTRPWKVLVLRSLIPRTFVDCNRAVDADSADLRRSGLTPAWPEYVTDETDRRTLSALYHSYRETAAAAYDLVCGSGGLALILHSYAPRSVQIDRIDERIVEQLHEAYRPEVFATWPARPAVDVISETLDGEALAAAELVASVRRRYAEIGVRATANESYRLHPSTMAHRYSIDFPEQVLCVEINRELLAAPFDPFVEMRIGESETSRMSQPLAAALADERSRRSAISRRA